jgi:hypothetical protein
MSRKLVLESKLARNVEAANLEPYFIDIAKTLSKEKFNRKYAEAEEILKLVGAGVFLAAAVVAPNLPKVLKPLWNKEEWGAWKRFNIPYLKRTISRLEKQKLVVVRTDGGSQVVEITESGKRRVLRLALNELTVKKPSSWDGYWRIVSYDIPEVYADLRVVFQNYLKAWGFYPFHQSMYLQAYPCERQVEFLREYLGIGKYVRILKVVRIENDRLFRDFFSV